LTFIIPDVVYLTTKIIINRVNREIVIHLDYIGYILFCISVNTLFDLG